MAQESRSQFTALRYSESSEAELLDVASSSAVDAQSLPVKRLDIELRQSDQKGDVVVTGPRWCLVLNLSQYV